jgi:hypothetical protein
MTSVVTSPTASIIRVLIGVMLSERRRLIFALTIDCVALFESRRELRRAAR